MYKFFFSFVKCTSGKLVYKILQQQKSPEQNCEI